MESVLDVLIHDESIWSFIQIAIEVHPIFTKLVQKYGDMFIQSDVQWYKDMRKKCREGEHPH